MSTTTGTTTTATPSIDDGQKGLDQWAKDLGRAAERLRAQFNRGRITADEKLMETCRLVSEACGSDHHDDPHYTPVEVLGWFARAVEMGCEVPVVGGRNLERLARLELIPNARFRERFEQLHEEEGLSSKRIGLMVGMTRQRDGRTEGDASGVERMLGLTPSHETDSNGHEYDSMRLFITYDQAVALADALGLDYPTVGI